MILDISQPVPSCRVWPGDPAPTFQPLLRTDRGEGCNLTAFSMCAHNGTHADAPFHFLPSGRTIGQLGLEPFVGDCFVARHTGSVALPEAEAILDRARAAGAAKRVLLAGPAVVTEAAARVFAAAGLKLLGVESQTVGPEDAPAQVHRVLLGAGVVLLEGLVLTGVPEGRYFLSAAPLNLGDCDGAPCRAYLIR